MIKLDKEIFERESVRKVISEIYGDEKKGLILHIQQNIKKYVKENELKGSKYEERSISNYKGLLSERYKMVFGSEIQYEKLKELLLGNKQIIDAYIDSFIDGDKEIYSIVEGFYYLNDKIHVKNIRHNLEKMNYSGQEMQEKLQDFISDFSEWYKKNTSIAVDTANDILAQEHREKFLKENEEYTKYYITVKILEQIKQEKHFDYNKLNAYRHRLLVAMDIRVCPYCNRQYINKYNKDKKEQITADLDHFYPKSKYPYLALSLYNFVPSCQICNSRFKVDKNEWYDSHLYPYEEGFEEEVKFEISDNSIDYLVCKNREDDFEITITKTDNPRINRSTKIFNLEEVYQSHKDYVKEIIYKSIFYNETQREEYYKSFNELFASPDELIEIIFGSYIVHGEYSNQPLSRLAHDILIELGIECNVTEGK